MSVRRRPDRGRGGNEKTYDIRASWVSYPGGNRKRKSMRQVRRTQLALRKKSGARVYCRLTQTGIRPRKRGRCTMNTCKMLLKKERERTVAVFLVSTSVQDLKGVGWGKVGF